MSEKTCKERIREQYDNRNESVAKMIKHYIGAANDDLDELTEQFVEEFTKTENREPTEDEVDKFRENAADTEYNEESLMEFPLGFTIHKVVKIELSTGGPADYLEVFIDPEYTDTVVRIVYHFADWFDHAEMEVSENDPLWEFAEYYCEGILDLI
ncbi:hypothetical protein EB001_00295 [bacterium]|nr:hypothetical protein [bacterium]